MGKSTLSSRKARKGTVLAAPCNTCKTHSASKRETKLARPHVQQKQKRTKTKRQRKQRNLDRIQPYVRLTTLTKFTYATSSLGALSQVCSVSVLPQTPGLEFSRRAVTACLKPPWVEPGFVQRKALCRDAASFLAISTARGPSCVSIACACENNRHNSINKISSQTLLG